MKLKWTDRKTYISDGYLLHCFIYDPEKSGNYWITDGNTVLMAFYKMTLMKWLLYSYDSEGAIIGIFEDNKFNIIAYSEINTPKIPKRLRSGDDLKN